MFFAVFECLQSIVKFEIAVFQKKLTEQRGYQRSFIDGTGGVARTGSSEPRNDPESHFDALTGRFVRSTPNGIRTRAATLRGWCPRPLDDGGGCPGNVPQGEVRA